MTIAQAWHDLLQRRARRERLARLACFAATIFLTVALFYGATNSGA